MVELEDRTSALIAPRRGQDGALAAALGERFGVKLPEMGEFARAEGFMLARTAPHQLMAMRDGAGLFAELEAALGGVAGVFDLSDARIAVRLAGTGGADPAARPAADRSAGACSLAGASRPSSALLTVLLCQVDDAPTYELSCATSYRGSFLRALH